MLWCLNAIILIVLTIMGVLVYLIIAKGTWYTGALSSFERRWYQHRDMKMSASTIMASAEERKPLVNDRQVRSYSISEEIAVGNKRSLSEVEPSATDPVKVNIIPKEAPNDLQSTPSLHTVTHSWLLVNLGLGALVLVLLVSMSVVGPSMVDAFGKSGSDAYVALIHAQVWAAAVTFLHLFVLKTCIDRTTRVLPEGSWVLVLQAGLLYSINDVVAYLTALPSRTPPYIQAIITTLAIPIMLAARYFMLQKGVTWRQAACLAVMMVGVFICLEPSFFGINIVSGNGVVDSKNWYFVLLNVSCAFPSALAKVVYEKDQKRPKASSPTEFLDHLRNGFECLYGSDPTCPEEYVRSITFVFIISSIYVSLLMVLLVRHGEGAMMVVVTSALSVPLSSLFWTLFSDVPYIHWDPRFVPSSSLLILGLLMIVPALILYTYFSPERLNTAKPKMFGEREIDRPTDK